MKRAVVVGSGAGGAIAARELQGAFDVTVLEAGGDFRPFTGNLSALERLRSTRLLFDERLITLLFPAMRISRTSDGWPLVHGCGTGGTTTLATGNAMRCDEGLRELGIDLETDFLALQDELPISTAHARRWRPQTRSLFASCEKLGLQPKATPKLVEYDRCIRCGRCVLGCRSGAKWDSRRMLRQAMDSGARLITGAPAERVVVDAAGRATGLIYRRHGRYHHIPADLVLLAAGGLGTPRILERSGIRTEDRLFVDPVLCVSAPGEHADLDREIPMPFVVQRQGYIVSPYFDYLSFFFNRDWLLPRGRIITLMVKLADSERGSCVGRVRKALTSRDRTRLAEATALCKEILGDLGVAPDSAFLGTVNGGHPGGTLPLTGREMQALHPDRLPPNVYVADASLLPGSLGRPPMLTIMALARRIVSECRDRLA